jgi:serine kinase of HPr protein (carbohydrate metabolism regulator)
MTIAATVAKPGEAAASPGTYIHATALAVGEVGLMIRGRSGAGKSRLALELIAEANRRGLFARLVGDDRVAIAARGGRLIARGHPRIAGRIESRGEGILELGHEDAIVVRLVVDLGSGLGAGVARLPPANAKTYLCDIELPQLALDASRPQPAGIALNYLLRMGDG